MEVDAPPHRITRIRRFIGPNREVTFFHGHLHSLPEINQVAHFLLVDFFDHRTDFDPGIVGTGIPDHFKNRDAFGTLELQFPLNFFINRADCDPEFLTELDHFLHRHLSRADPWGQQ